MSAVPNRQSSLAWRCGLVDAYGDITFPAFMLIFLAAMTVIAAIVAVIAISSSRAVGRTTCSNFATQTGFQTKFRVLNFFDTGTCLAKAPNGKWVQNSRIYQFIQETKR